MAVKYEAKRTINFLLFLLRSLGGKVGLEKIYALFYLADLKFLATHGRLAFGYRYLAMRSGPVPFSVFWLLLEMSNGADDSFAEMIKRHIKFDDGLITSLVKYDIGYLSQDEVACLFDVINKYKDAPLEQLKALVKGLSWQATEQQSFISVTAMAKEVDASEYVLMTVSLRYHGEKWPGL